MAMLELRLRNAGDGRLAVEAIVDGSPAASGTSAPIARRCGRALGEALFCGSVAQAFRDVVDRVAPAAVTLVYATDDPDLLALPFETAELADGTVPALHPAVSVRRRDLVPSTAPLATIASPLRVLVAIHVPGGEATPEREAARQRARPALEPATTAATVHVRVLDVSHPDAIREALATDACDVLHLAGPWNLGTGTLVADTAGGPTLTPVAIVDALRVPGRPPPLVFLCPSRDGAIVQPETAFAQGLVREGLPLVVAMQAPVTCAYATQLARLFYEGLAAAPTVDPGRPLANARRVLDGRRGATPAGPPTDDAIPEWAAAALFSGSVQTLGLEVAEGTARTVPSEPPQPAARRMDENVRFTVFAPKAVRPQRWYTMLAFAHLAERPDDADPSEPDPIEEVGRRAAAVLGEQRRQYRESQVDASAAIPREEDITFLPVVEGVEFNPPRRVFRWVESVHDEHFRLQAEREATGRSLRGTLSVFAGAILVADIPLVFAVRDDAPAPDSPHPIDEPPARAAPYLRVFPSYSHLDVAIVQQFERFSGALARYTRDAIALRAGDDWRDAIRHLIRDADVFQLFWSTHSMRSEHVRTEWEFALDLGREGFVRPTYWEDPLPADPAAGLPPPALERLHFLRLVPESTPGPVRSEPDRAPVASDVPPRAPRTIEDLNTGAFPPDREPPSAARPPGTAPPARPSAAPTAAIGPWTVLVVAAAILALIALLLLRR